jgi:hypothetical protein
MNIERLTPSEAFVAKAAFAAAMGAALWASIRRIAARRTADPWTSEIDASVRARQAVPVCINCLFPQEDRLWFCPHCSFPAGDYVTLMPFVQNFALGEAFRRGVTGPPERRRGARALAWLASAMVYRPFVLFYWFWLARKQIGSPIGEASHPGWDPHEEP